MTEDRTEALIRRALAAHPRPEAPSRLTDEVMGLLAARQRMVRRWQPAALVASWLFAAAGAGWVLAGLEWPAWGGPLLAGLAFVLVPLGFAVALWPGSILGGIAAWSRPFLGEPGPLSAARSRR